MARTWHVYLYIPNLIGYARIMATITAFVFAFSNKKFFVGLYLISFICDELDGRFARLLNQMSSFGAALDMVTDRVSTAALLVVLSHKYKSSIGFFFALLSLDISSHWFQMYSTLLASKTSHKDVVDCKIFLLKAYYQYRIFMGYCCVGAEVLYLVLYVLSEDQFSCVVDVLINASRKSFPWAMMGLVALPGWFIKQLVNIMQIISAAEGCIIYDIQKQTLRTLA